MEKGQPRKKSKSKNTFTQIPQPMHSSSEMKAILDAEETSIHNFPKMIIHGKMQSTQYLLSSRKMNVGQFTCLDDGATLLTFLPALFRLAPICSDNSYTGKTVCHFLRQAMWWELLKQENCWRWLYRVQFERTSYYVWSTQHRSDGPTTSLFTATDAGRWRIKVDR